jgi:hypothetical protein
MKSDLDVSHVTVQILGHLLRIHAFGIRNQLFDIQSTRSCKMKQIRDQIGNCVSSRVGLRCGDEFGYCT